MPNTAEIFPLTVVTADFNAGYDRSKPPVTVHTDSIQAMIIVCRDQEDLNLMIKGRVEEEADRISADSLYQDFVKTRAERKHMVHRDMQNPELMQSSLTVEQSANGEPFDCKFFDMNRVVEAVFSGATNANRLMVNFGGATEVEIGSSSCSLLQLEHASEVLIKEVRARQLGELPVSLLASRKPYALRRER